MRNVSELTDKELLLAYSSVDKRLKAIYKEKKDLEEEMAKRYENELESNR